MIICPKCSTGNKDNAILCKDCDTYIGNKAPEPYTDYSGALLSRMQSERRQLFDPLHIMLMCIAAPIAVLTVTSVMSSMLLSGYTVVIALLFPYTAYYCICYPKKVYEIKHRFEQSKRRTDMEMPDSFPFKCILSGWILIVSTILYMVVLTFF